MAIAKSGNERCYPQKRLIYKQAPVGYARDCAVRIATDAAIPARNQPSRDGVFRAQGILTVLLSVEKRGGGIGRHGMAAYRLGMRPDRKSCEVQILARALSNKQGGGSSGNLQWYAQAHDILERKRAGPAARRHR
jgi:hypothetical protein